MSEASAELKEINTQQPELVDILDRQYKVHWAEMKNLPKILRRGLYSPAFARRVGDEDYETRGSSSDEKSIHLTFPPHYMWGHEVEKAVGIVIKSPVDEVRDRSNMFRISPHQFVGLVVADTLPVRTYTSGITEIKETIATTKPLVLRRVKNIRRIMDESIDNSGLPIYGMSGDLYWPKRLSHAEIVQMLAEKQKAEAK